MLFSVYLGFVSKLVGVGLGFISGYNMRIQIIVNVFMYRIYIYNQYTVYLRVPMAANHLKTKNKNQQKPKA